MYFPYSYDFISVCNGKKCSLFRIILEFRTVGMTDKDNFIFEENIENFCTFSTFLIPSATYFNYFIVVHNIILFYPILSVCR